MNFRLLMAFCGIYCLEFHCYMLYARQNIDENFLYIIMMIEFNKDVCERELALLLLINRKLSHFVGFKNKKIFKCG